MPRAISIAKTARDSPKVLRRALSKGKRVSRQASKCIVDHSMLRLARRCRKPSALFNAVLSIKGEHNLSQPQCPPSCGYKYAFDPVKSACSVSEEHWPEKGSSPFKRQKSHSGLYSRHFHSSGNRSESQREVGRGQPIELEKQLQQLQDVPEAPRRSGQEVWEVGCWL